MEVESARMKAMSAVASINGKTAREAVFHCYACFNSRRPELVARAIHNSSTLDVSLGSNRRRHRTHSRDTRNRIHKGIRSHRRHQQVRDPRPDRLHRRRDRASHSLRRASRNRRRENRRHPSSFGALARSAPGRYHRVEPDRWRISASRSGAFPPR